MPTCFKILNVKRSKHFVSLNSIPAAVAQGRNIDRKMFVISFVNTVSVTLFTTIHFPQNLRMGPKSQSVT